MLMSGIIVKDENKTVGKIRNTLVIFSKQFSYVATVGESAAKSNLNQKHHLFIHKLRLFKTY